MLKLGGSVLTEKLQPETIDTAALATAAETLANDDTDDLVVVHGGGSFGHHHAEAYGVSKTDGTRDPNAVYTIHDAMRRLNATVVERFQDQGLPALPVHPLSLAHRDDSGKTTLPTGAIERLLAEGFVPVLHGDIVGQAGAGATVLSGDEIVVSVADSIDAERIGICSGVPGVLDADESVIDRIEDYASVADALGGSDAPDVTGGMAGKVQALLGVSTPAAIFGLAELDAFLAGESPGTHIGTDN